MVFVRRCLLLFSVVALVSGCSVLGMTDSGPDTMTQPGFTYGVGLSAAPIKIDGGNLAWHRRLPDDTYTLEAIAIGVLNSGEFGIFIAQLEVVIDGKAKLFDVEQLVPGGTEKNLVVQPMMNGYDGGSHFVYIALLNDEGRLLAHNSGEVVGPLAPDTN